MSDLCINIDSCLVFFSSIEPFNFRYKKEKEPMKNSMDFRLEPLVGLSIIYIYRPDLARKFIPLLGEEDSVQVDYSARYM